MVEITCRGSVILYKAVDINSLSYNAFNVYRRELAPGTVSLTGDRAQGDDSKHWAYSNWFNDSIWWKMCTLNMQRNKVRYYQPKNNKL